MKNFYTIYFKRNTYNQHRSYPQNWNRYIGSKIVDNLEDIPATLEELKAKGYKIKSIYSRAGKRIGGFVLWVSKN